MFRNSVRVLIASACLALLCGLCFRFWRYNQPVYTFGADAAHADPAGPAYAMKRAHILLELARNYNYNIGKLGLANLRLPDQGSAEVPASRAANTSAWSFEQKSPIFENVAFWTDLYAKRNHTYYQDGKMNSHPAGFYIVALKNGEVNQVPVSELRVLEYKGEHILVFPGVIGYKKTLPPFFSYQPVKQH